MPYSAQLCVLTMTTRLAMSVAMLGADSGSVRSVSAAISVRATMFFFSTVVSSVSAWANATTRPDWAVAIAPGGWQMTSEEGCKEAMTVRAARQVRAAAPMQWQAEGVAA